MLRRRSTGEAIAVAARPDRKRSPHRRPDGPGASFRSRRVRATVPEHRFPRTRAWIPPRERFDTGLRLRGGRACTRRGRVARAGRPTRGRSTDGERFAAGRPRSARSSAGSEAAAPRTVEANTGFRNRLARANGCAPSSRRNGPHLGRMATGPVFQGPAGSPASSRAGSRIVVGAGAAERRPPSGRASQGAGPVPLQPARCPRFGPAAASTERGLRLCGPADRSFAPRRATGALRHDARASPRFPPRPSTVGPHERAEERPGAPRRNPAPRVRRLHRGREVGVAGVTGPDFPETGENCPTSVRDLGSRSPAEPNEPKKRRDPSEARGRRPRFER